MKFLAFVIIIGIIYVLYKNFSMSGRYAKSLDNMTDDELVRERNKVVNKMNNGYSFENRRSAHVHLEKLSKCDRRLKKRGYDVPK